jgi:hypothetical protein
MNPPQADPTLTQGVPAPRKKTSVGFVAWWGIIPALAFIAVEVIRGWPVAQARASRPEFAISYFMGGTVGGILIALLIAWVGYRLVRKSRLAGSIVFTLVLCFFCVSVALQSPTPRTQTNYAGGEPGGAADSQSPSAFPLFGVILNSPPQWQQLPPDRTGIVARWISPESREGSVQAMIMIEMKIPLGPDIAQYAGGMAKSWNGTVADKQEDLDGEVARRIVAQPRANLQPVEGLVSIHDGRLYLIEGGVTAGHSCHDEIEMIRRGWKWAPLDPPVKHLEFRKQPAVLFNGHLSVNFPAAMNLFDKGLPENNVGISLLDYRVDRRQFTAIIQFGKLNDGDTLANAENRLAQGMKAKFNLPETITWHAVNVESMQAAVTQVVAGPPSDGKNWLMWGIVGLPGNQIVLVNFTLLAEDPADRAIYAKTAEKIVGTISIVK